jgi:ornithine cyclodeaminase/alanine dehydrogenase-like protein (mu-crystallin family)
MRFVSADDLARLLTPQAVADALADAFRGDIVVPNRHHHEVGHGADHATHLLMPAWTADAPAGGFIGCKVVNVFPGNGQKGLPAIHGTYLLMSGETGAPLAAIDGTALTVWRTAAASALAGRHLVRKGAARMLMVGAGALAPFFIRAHAAEHALTDIAIWNHRPDKALALAADLTAQGLPVRAATDLEAEARAADLISCATLSKTPLVRGDWLKAGAHLDLAGAYNMMTRECDDAAIARARVFIDTKAGLTEGGDVAQAIRAGAVTADHVRGTLFDLCRGEVAGRQSADEITLFKSIGTAIEDLAAAMLVWQRVTA